jgi:hypothetical protein
MSTNRVDEEQQSSLENIFPLELKSIIHKYAFSCEFCEDESCRLPRHSEELECDACDSVRGKCIKSKMIRCGICEVRSYCKGHDLFTKCENCGGLHCDKCAENERNICPCGRCSQCAYVYMYKCRLCRVTMCSECNGGSDSGRCEDCDFNDYNPRDMRLFQELN